MYNKLGQQLHTWQIQWAYLKETCEQTSGLGTRVQSRMRVLRSILLCPTHGDASLCEATASPQTLLRTGSMYTASIPATLPSQPQHFFSACLFGNPHGCQLPPCCPPPAPCQPGQALSVANVHLDNRTSRQLAKSPLRNKSLPTDDSSPPSYQVHSSCQHWREASCGDTPSEKVYQGPSWCCSVPALCC